MVVIVDTVVHFGDGRRIRQSKLGRRKGDAGDLGGGGVGCVVHVLPVSSPPRFFSAVHGLREKGPERPERPEREGTLGAFFRAFAPREFERRFFAAAKHLFWTPSVVGKTCHL